MGLPIASPNVPSLTIGPRVFTDLANLITLVGYTVANPTATLRKMNATAGYVVTAGKTLHILALKCVNNSSGLSGAGVNICYGDNDVGYNSNTDQVNRIASGGSDGMVVVTSSMGTSGAFQFDGFSGVDFSVPAGKYPSIRGANCLIIAYGYEV